MLAARKDQLYAHVRHQALELRQAELEQLVQRYASLIAVASLASGFAFSGLVEFDVPDEVMNEEDDEENISTLGYIRRFHHMFYLCGCLALTLGIYVTSVSTVLISCGLRLALQGGTKHALDRAVAVLRQAFPTVICAGSCALLSMQLATVALVWIKTEAWDSGTQVATACVIGVGTVLTIGHGARLFHRLRLELGIDGGVGIDVPTAAGVHHIELEDIAAPTSPDLRSAAAAKGDAPPSPPPSPRPGAAEGAEGAAAAARPTRASASLSTRMQAGAGGCVVC